MVDELVIPIEDARRLAYAVARFCTCAELVPADKRLCSAHELVVDHNAQRHLVFIRYHRLAAMRLAEGLGE
jgi:hypothetical protein